MTYLNPAICALLAKRLVVLCYNKSISDKIYSNDNINILNDKMIESELDILRSQKSVCPKNLNTMFKYLESFTSKHIEEYFKNAYFSPSVMNSILCITETILHTSDVKHGLTPAEKYKEWIKTYKVIGAPSLEGNVILSSIIGDENDSKENSLYVIKAPRQPKYDFTNEAFIGLMGTNKLREKIPKYAYVFANRQVYQEMVKLYPYVVISRYLIMLIMLYMRM